MKTIFTKKKRLLTLLLAASLIGCLLIGCGGKEKEEKTSETTTAQSSSNNSEDSTANGAQSASDTESSQDTDAGTGTPKALEVGDPAPDFTAELKGGDSFHLSDYDDKVVLINIWATWCGPCVGEMPAFEKLYNECDGSYTILCVDALEDPSTVDSFIDENGYSFPIAYDTDGKIINLYPSDGIPYTVVINKGVVSDIFIGSYGADEQYKTYRSAIDKCLE